MLVDITVKNYRDSILAMIGSLNGNDHNIERIAAGIYLCPHFNFANEIEEKVEGFSKYVLFMNGNFGQYGVCDNYEQILEQCPELITSDKKFVISLTLIRKSQQSPEGDWRWHKWGSYIGTQKPQCEYIYDEPEIEKVYCYHIYELI